MAVYTFFDQKIGLGSVCGKWITEKINELGGEATQNTSDYSILITKFGSIENETVYYSSASISASYSDNPYFDAIISDTPGREFFLIIDKQIGSNIYTKTTMQRISFFFFKDATGKLNWLISSTSGAHNYSNTELNTVFGVPVIVLSTPDTNSDLDLTRQNSANKFTSPTTGSGYNYAERLLSACDISNLFLYTSSYVLASQTIYTDEAGVEYLGVHELFAVRKDKYDE